MSIVLAMSGDAWGFLGFQVWMPMKGYRRKSVKVIVAMNNIIVIMMWGHLTYRHEEERAWWSLVLIWNNRQHWKRIQHSWCEIELITQLRSNKGPLKLFTRCKSQPVCCDYLHKSNWGGGEGVKSSQPEKSLTGMTNLLLKRQQWEAEPSMKKGCWVRKSRCLLKTCSDNSRLKW